MSSDRQNLDNHIGDRSSTRLFHTDSNHHSRSSFSLGWSGGEPAGQHVSSNKFANGSNQNAGNVISERSSTRLHAPPGGSSSDIFNRGPAPTNVSSNKFANGSNQNAGNVISERSSTRLHAPPGGRSSDIFNLGPDPASSAQQAVSSNKFANGSNQNAGNVISERSSTRLHAPPGGKSSDIFNRGPDPAPVKVNRAPAVPTTKTFGAHAARPSSGEDSRAPISDKTNADVSSGYGQKPPPQRQAQAAPGTSANAFANGSNQNCGNFITDKPTSRVLAPPGGRSSIFFG